jgi:hypothetical protein
MAPITFILFPRQRIGFSLCVILTAELIGAVIVGSAEPST